MVMKIKIMCILIIFLGITIPGHSQQMPVFSQYKKNRFFFNPALAGARGYTSISLAARNQWLGFENPPRTVVVSGEGRLLKKALDIKKNIFGNKRVARRKKGNMGFGGAVFADKNSHISKTGVKGSYAYHIKFPEYKQLSFGISATGYQMKIDKDKLTLEEPGDPVMENVEPAYSTDVSAGILYMKHQKYYAGLSFKHIIQTVNIIQRSYDNTTLRHYYFMGGYTFDLDKDFSLEPSTIMQFNEKSIPLFKADVSMRLNYKQKWWLGLSYRTTNDLIIMGGIRYKDYIIGYSYDYGMGKLISHTFGSHEISVVYRFGSQKRKFRWKDRY